MAKIYTKTGDDGTTSLLSGARVIKSDPRLEAYGQVDHLNSMLGVLTQYLEKGSEGYSFLLDVQNNLFNLGALLACPEEDIEKFKLKQIENEFIECIENNIDKLDSQLPTLKNFILPGGTLGAANAHLCRTQSRNVERLMVALKDSEGFIPENSIIFINRLSDYFFNLSRVINLKEGIEEVIWKG